MLVASASQPTLFALGVRNQNKGKAPTTRKAFIALGIAMHATVRSKHKLSRTNAVTGKLAAMTWSALGWLRKQGE